MASPRPSGGQYYNIAKSAILWLPPKRNFASGRTVSIMQDKPDNSRHMTTAVFGVLVLPLAKAVVSQRRKYIAVFGHTVAVTALGNSRKLFLKSAEAFDFGSNIGKLC